MPTEPSLVEAMKGLSWESPRGPMMIDPETRDVVHNVYISKVETRETASCSMSSSRPSPMVKEPEPKQEEASTVSKP